MSYGLPFADVRFPSIHSFHFRLVCPSSRYSFYSPSVSSPSFCEIIGSTFLGTCLWLRPRNRLVAYLPLLFGHIFELIRPSWHIRCSGIHPLLHLFRRRFLLPCTLGYLVVFTNCWAVFFARKYLYPFLGYCFRVRLWPHPLLLSLALAFFSVARQVNGQVKQNGSTSDMMFRIPALIEHVSSIMSLEVSCISFLLSFKHRHPDDPYTPFLVSLLTFSTFLGR